MAACQRQKNKYKGGPTEGVKWITEGCQNTSKAQSSPNYRDQSENKQANKIISNITCFKPEQQKAQNDPFKMHKPITHISKWKSVSLRWYMVNGWVITA